VCVQLDVKLYYELFVAGGLNGCIYLWDVPTSVLLRIIDMPSPSQGVKQLHVIHPSVAEALRVATGSHYSDVVDTSNSSSGSTHTAFGMMAPQIVALDHAGKLIVIDLKAPRASALLELDNPGNEGNITSFVVSDDAQTLILTTSTGKMLLMDLPSAIVHHLDSYRLSSEEPSAAEEAPAAAQNVFSSEDYAETTTATSHPPSESDSGASSSHRGTRGESAPASRESESHAQDASGVDESTSGGDQTSDSHNVSAALDAIREDFTQAMRGSVRHGAGRRKRTAVQAPEVCHFPFRVKAQFLPLQHVSIQQAPRHDGPHTRRHYLLHLSMIYWPVHWWCHDWAPVPMNTHERKRRKLPPQRTRNCAPSLICTAPCRRSTEASAGASCCGCLPMCRRMRTCVHGENMLRGKIWNRNIP
jgi:hypothetical protein